MKSALLLFLLVRGAWAQEPQFKTHAREVVIPVSVTTQRGNTVETLAAEDFTVLNDGRPQAVRMSERELGTALPVHAVMVLQTRGASEAALAKIRKTASVVSAYITNDIGSGSPSLVAVVGVADEVDTIQDFTADPYVLGDAFAKVSSGGGGPRLVDGVSLACDLLAARKERARRVIVMISEARDAQSKSKFADVVVKAQKDDVVIYTISYSAFTTPFTQKASERARPVDQPGVYDPKEHGGIGMLAIPILLAQMARKNVSEAFAQATGGGHETFTTLRGLETQLTAVGNEIHNRYTLTFVPPEGQAAGYHSLSVSVRNGGPWRVHARAGYWSEGE